MKYIVEKEEQLHSPVLADLFDIEGSHRQKDIFYYEFLEQISTEVNVKRFQIENDLFFSVELEKWIGNGEIDIFISHNSPKKKFAIAIENKIYAKDQPDQLKRYALFLEREYKDDFLLLYLTPNNRLPEMPFSIEKEHFDRLVTENKLRLITYKKHILPFLENSLLKIGDNIASSNIRQYLQVIKNNFVNG